MIADPQTLANGLAAVVAGLITSPHCLLMCGPLSCGVMGGPKTSPEEASVGWVCYHCMRVLTYGIIGAISGALGYTLAQSAAWDMTMIFPWVLVGFLGLFAAGVHRRLPKPAWLGRYAMQATQKTRDSRTWLKGLVLGLVTPLLPCGPLYGVFWLAMLSGSPLYGLEIGVGFGMGTILLLWIGQTQFLRLQGILKPNRIALFQRSAAGIAAIVIAWRASGMTPERLAELCGF